MNVLFVGHRGVGKSTIGDLLARELDYGFADVDALIEQATGTTPAELIASDESAFRNLENEIVADAIANADRRIVAAGGGLRVLPEDAFVIWLDREGWEEAAAERHRLRPEMTFDEEVAWMIETREHRWAAAAHLLYSVPRGRAPIVAARDLAHLVRWALHSPNAWRQRTWIVPATAGELRRAERDALGLGFAGVEARSDILAEFPQLSCPTLASVRSETVHWVRHALESASALDVDLGLLESTRHAGLFRARPRPLTLSMHPTKVDPEDVAALARAAREAQAQHPDWAPFLALKYAPAVDNADDVGMGDALVEPLRRAGISLTYLPQGHRWAWTRPILAARNAANYVAARLRASRVRHDQEPLTPFDLQDWLPHLSGAEPEIFDCLIGRATDFSRGDLWHRAAALRSGERASYVKADVEEEELETVLSLCAKLGVRGISVTSPLKRRVLFVRPDDSNFGTLLDPEDAARAATRGLPVRTGNTLVRSNGGWLATDTDEIGMAACLEAIENAGVGPGTVAIFGRGGVTPAVLRAIDQSDWFVVVHASAREGWPEATPGFVTLVVNAAGPASSVMENAPRCDAWLDLHYVGVAANPAPRLHLSGDVFFEAQAEAQREAWRNA